ncbi:ribonuclease H-like domain-containing protein [Tanacetum coccineum]
MLFHLPPTGLFSLPKFDLSNSGLEEFQQSEFEGYGPKTSKSVSEDISNEADCNYHQRERVVSGNNYTRVNYNYSAKKAHPSAYRNMVPRAVLMKTGLRSLNTARPVNTAHPKTTVYSARPMSRFSKSAQSTVKRPYQIRTTLTNKNFSQKVNTAKGKFYTARPKAVNTARPNSAVVNAVRANQVNAIKASACWVWRPTKLNSASIILTETLIMLSSTKKEERDMLFSGCSRHNDMIHCSLFYLTSRNLMEDMLHLGEELNEGKLLIKELLKLLVLFSLDMVFVLSPDFKLADESQVLLKVPRKNNMYSVDMKNIVPKECLTCLVAKATLDESMLWHRRLGHVKFKTINEAVNTACYVQNRVLVVKPHNKTPYELFRGRTPALSFMRPSGCHVTILNTLDYLGKFDGKSDEGFFVGYSMNSKSFKVYNIRSRKVEESLHISDAGKKDDEGVNKESRIIDQERPENSSQDVNIVGPSINTASTNVNTSSLNINIVSLTVTTAPLEATHADFFGDET